MHEWRGATAAGRRCWSASPRRCATDRRSPPTRRRRRAATRRSRRAAGRWGAAAWRGRCSGHGRRRRRPGKWVVAGLAGVWRGNVICRLALGKRIVVAPETAARQLIVVCRLNRLGWRCRRRRRRARIRGRRCSGIRNGCPIGGNVAQLARVGRWRMIGGFALHECVVMAAETPAG